MGKVHFPGGGGVRVYTVERKKKERERDCGYALYLPVPQKVGFFNNYLFSED